MNRIHKHQNFNKINGQPMFSIKTISSALLLDYYLSRIYELWDRWQVKLLLHDFFYFNFPFLYTQFSSDIIRSNFPLKNFDELMSHVNYTAIHLFQLQTNKIIKELCTWMFCQSTKNEWILWASENSLKLAGGGIALCQLGAGCTPSVSFSHFSEVFLQVIIKSYYIFSILC